MSITGVQLLCVRELPKSMLISILFFKRHRLCFNYMSKSLEEQNIYHGFEIAICLCKSYHFYYRWEDNLNNGSGGRGFTRSNSSTPTPSRGRNGGRGSRGRGRNASNSSNGTFVTATGDPISGRRCYTCGDPSHFANVCPNRGL
jgi:hypothetical protein